MSEKASMRATNEMAREVLDRMLTRLQRDVKTSALQGSAPNTTLIDIISDWARNPEFLESGEFMSRAMRLPDEWRHACMEVLHRSTAAYRDSAFRLMSVRIKNFGSRPVRVLTEIKKYPKVDKNGKPSTEVWDEVKKWTEIAPGEVKALSPQWASHALWANSRDAWPVYGWRTWPHQNDTLREVGYVFELDAGGETQRVDSNTFKRERINEALALADMRIGEQDPDGAASALADVGHLLIDGEPVQAVEDKRAEVATLAAAIEAAKSEATTRRVGRPRKVQAEE